MSRLVPLRMGRRSESTLRRSSFGYEGTLQTSSTDHLDGRRRLDSSNLVWRSTRGSEGNGACPALFDFGRKILVFCSRRTKSSSTNLPKRARLSTTITIIVLSSIIFRMQKIRI